MQSSLLSTPSKKLLITHLRLINLKAEAKLRMVVSCALNITNFGPLLSIACFI